MEKIIIGRKDKVTLPDFKIKDIQVKIDSGAYTSSIDCHSVNEITIGDKVVLEVVFLETKHHNYTGEVFQFEKYKIKKVKSSNGKSQSRYFINAKIILFEKEYLTEFSLTKRHEMKNPILLGRKLLNHHFLIDSSKVNLSYKNKKNVVQ